MCFSLVHLIWDSVLSGLEEHKKTQAEMKDILTEIKDNLQKINSRVDEANNQINDLEHKKKTFNQNNNKKTESKKPRIV